MAKNKAEIFKDLDYAELFEEIFSERFLKVLSWSGRYDYSSWKISYKKAIELEKDLYARQLIRVNPGYKLQRPLMRAAELSEILYTAFTTIRLHIDIDATDPLDIVSGTVKRWPRFMVTSSSAHFIGRVTSNTVISGGRELVVEDFSFDWPRTSKAVDRLEITLSDILHPVASATFYCTAEDLSYGPYQVPRTSRYFREVEFEIDREDGARMVEPYNTQTHPDRPASLPNQNITIKGIH